MGYIKFPLFTRDHVNFQKQIIAKISVGNCYAHQAYVFIDNYNTCKRVSNWVYYICLYYIVILGIWLIILYFLSFCPKQCMLQLLNLLGAFNGNGMLYILDIISFAWASNSQSHAMQFKLKSVKAMVKCNIY